MKINQIFKWAAAVFMAAITALSVMPATAAFVAGDIGTITQGQTASKLFTPQGRRQTERI